VNIPFFGLRRQYQNLREELLDTVDSVLKTGQVLDGDYTEAFELQMAGRCHRQYALAVNSCSMGLFLALEALGIRMSPIILPTVSFPATLNAALMNHNIPVYCDIDDHALIDLETLTFNPSSYKIQAMMYVNIFGNVVDYERMHLITDFFNKGEITVIEDATQSFGAYYKDTPSGKLGHVSVLSFDPTKNLPNYGSGGMILTDDTTTYLNLKNLRDNGKEDGHMSHGTNTKMSEVDCAQMLVKLKYFDEWQRRRTEIADFYTEHLRDYVRVTKVSPDVTHAWHKFPIWFEDRYISQGPEGYPARHRVQQMLNGMGIETKVHYPTPLPELACNPHSNFMAMPNIYPMAELHSRTELSLPIYPELTDLEVEYIAESVIDCISSESIY
jgi:dTDP-4-amino-4,6-dideoxygalactose transaminase